jgi:hypothetical protein
MANSNTIQLDPKMRESIDAIKAELESGGARGVVVRSRQIGKTLALLEFVHENDPGNMVVIACNVMESDHIAHIYKKIFPDDSQPKFVSFQSVDDRHVIGTNRRWVTDEIWPGAVVRKSRAFELAPHLGTVGTPMCMDMHSH